MKKRLTTEKYNNVNVFQRDRIIVVFYIIRRGTRLTTEQKCNKVNVFQRDKILSWFYLCSKQVTKTHNREKYKNVNFFKGTKFRLLLFI